jgi:hypothetical protein
VRLHGRLNSTCLYVSEISGSPEEISWSPEGALELAEGAVGDDMVDGYIRGVG